jgi:hypothetical protein
MAPHLDKAARRHNVPHALPEVIDDGVTGFIVEAIRHRLPQLDRSKGSRPLRAALHVATNGGSASRTLSDYRSNPMPPADQR